MHDAGNMHSTDWLPVLFDGILGAIVGGLVSFAVAIFVLRRTRKIDLDAAREQVSLRAAETITSALGTYRQTAQLTTQHGRAHVREKSSTVLVDHLLLHAPALTDRRLAALLDETRLVIEGYQAFSSRLTRQAQRAHFDTVTLEVQGTEDRQRLDRTAFERLDKYLTYVVGAVGAYRSDTTRPSTVPTPSFDDLAVD